MPWGEVVTHSILSHWLQSSFTHLTLSPRREQESPWLCPVESPPGFTSLLRVAQNPRPSFLETDGRQLQRWDPGCILPWENQENPSYRSLLPQEKTQCTASPETHDLSLCSLDATSNKCTLQKNERLEWKQLFIKHSFACCVLLQ